jgi:hypothetical protein
LPVLARIGCCETVLFGCDPSPYTSDCSHRDGTPGQTLSQAVLNDAITNFRYCPPDAFLASAPMFVFSRRAIQRCIDELIGVLSNHQLEELVKRLNRVGSHRFAASWEVCLLHSLSRVGAILHEASLPSGRKPDISFTYPGENAIGFIADVTAISDQGLHSANPVQELSEELIRLARTVGLDPSHLRYDVRGQHDGPYGYQKTKLLLPPQAELPSMLIRLTPKNTRFSDDHRFPGGLDAHPFSPRDFGCCHEPVYSSS